MQRKVLPKVLLIGGLGFIGHNLALALKKRGNDVTIIDSLNVNNYYVLLKNKLKDENAERYLKFIDMRLRLVRDAGIDLIQADVRDYQLIHSIISSFQPGYIVHLAAVAHANRANKDPHATFNHSLLTLENSLNAARDEDLDLKRFIYFSSSMVYGNFNKKSVTEDEVCDPIGIYGNLKYAGERLMKAYNQVFDLPYSIIRPSALYGPRCVSRRVGQALIENVLLGKDLTVNGDGSDRLDFTYIDDLIQGVMCCMDNDNARNEIFNLTFGDARSLNQMIELIKAHFPEFVVNHHQRDKLMPERGTLSIEKAKSLLGYAPQYPLEKGFVDYIKWYQSIWPELVIPSEVEGSP